MVLLPVRVLVFGDTSLYTVLLLGPAVEESEKLCAVLLALLAAAYLLPRGRDAPTALRYWLFFAPWAVGGVYGMIEGFLVYPGEPSIAFTLRELAHGTFAALGLAAALWTWRELEAPYAGIALALGAAWSAHFGFNAVAVWSPPELVGFLEQGLFAVAVCAFTIVMLARLAAREPASRESAHLLAVRPRGG